MDAIAEVERLISPSIDDLGYELVRVQLSGDGAPTLQIMAERKDRGDMTVEDCAEISRLVSALLDVEDPVPGAYTLEVSSPGLDRPLMRIGDYDRFAGYEARVETRRLIDGRKRFRGRLNGVRGDAIVIDARETHQMQAIGADEVDYLVFGITLDEGGKTVVVE